jgi:hypothetical protein
MEGRLDVRSPVTRKAAAFVKLTVDFIVTAGMAVSMTSDRHYFVPQ